MNKIYLITLTMLFALLISCNGLTPDAEIEEEEQDTINNEESIDDALANNAEVHDEESDYVWDSNNVIQIELSGILVNENSDNVTVESGNVVINKSGNYSFSGELSNGQIIVNTEDEEIVRLILNGANITCLNSAPIYIKSAEKVLIALSENASNQITDGSTYNYDDVEDEEPNAAIYSKSDLTVFGDGSLVINANFNDGISSKDGLIIASGDFTVNAADDGIRGKDYLMIKNGNFTINASGDGLKSDNDNDETKGYIEILDGNFDINSKGDAISASTDLMIEYAEVNIATTGGTTSASSLKGLKAGVNIIIDDGIFSLDCTDDGIHSNQTITINAGTYEISSGDDAIHADYDLAINDGDINILKSYEGIESAKGNIEINKGIIHLKSSDDGINLAGGGDMMGGPGGAPGGGYGGTTSYGDYAIYINGGYIYVNASGDGIDANGSIEMTGGTVLVDGPTNNGNGALDHSGFSITGGLLIAAGSSGMAQAPSSSSSQYSALARFGTTISGGTIFHIQTDDGEEILTYKPSKNYQSVAFSSPNLKKGSYEIYTGGSSTGAETDGLYVGGSYTPGNLFVDFDISGIVAEIDKL